LPDAAVVTAFMRSGGSGKGSSVTSIVELHGIDKSFAGFPR